MDNIEIEKLLNITEDSVRIVDEAELYKDDDFYDGVEDKLTEPLIPIAKKVTEQPNIFDDTPPPPLPKMDFLREEAREEQQFKSSEDLLNFSEPSIETPKKVEKPKKPKNDDIEDIKILKSDDVKPGESEIDIANNSQLCI